MQNQTKLCLEQNIFPFRKKHIEIDPTQKKITISYHSFFKSECTQRRLYPISETTQREKHRSPGWFFSASILSLLLIAYFVGWALNLPQNFLQVGTPTALTIAAVLILVAAGAWLKFAYTCYDVILYFDAYTERVAFDLCTNKPGKATFDHFTNQLNYLIKQCTYSRTLRDILEEIPTQLLVDEFSESYINELVSRNVDVKHLFVFLQNRLENRQREQRR